MGELLYHTPNGFIGIISFLLVVSAIVFMTFEMKESVESEGVVVIFGILLALCGAYIIAQIHNFTENKDTIYKNNKRNLNEYYVRVDDNNYKKFNKLTKSELSYCNSIFMETSPNYVPDCSSIDAKYAKPFYDTELYYKEKARLNSTKRLKKCCYVHISEIPPTSIDDKDIK